MILVLADFTDPWSILVHRELSNRGQEVFWIQPAQLLERIKLNWPVMCGSVIVQGTLYIDGRPIALSDLTGVLARVTLPFSLELQDLASPDRDYVVKETTAAWLGLLHAMPCPVVNRPVPGGRPTLLAGSPLLAECAQRCGFVLPPSRCTSSRPDAILQFSAWSERAYLKPLSSSEPGTFLQPHDGVEQICRVMEQQAVSMQAIPEGQRVTVYVAGGEVAATIVRADTAQTASADMPFLPIQQCRELVQSLGLAFAECQLIVTREGPVYCLDVSAAPSFWRCPQEVQQQIVHMLAGYLSEPRSVPLHDSFDGTDGGSGVGQPLCEIGFPEC